MASHGQLQISEVFYKGFYKYTDERKQEYCCHQKKKGGKDAGLCKISY